MSTDDRLPQVNLLITVIMVILIWVYFLITLIVDLCKATLVYHEYIRELVGDNVTSQKDNKEFERNAYFLNDSSLQLFRLETFPPYMFFNFHKFYPFMALNIMAKTKSEIDLGNKNHYMESYTKAISAM